MPIIDNTGSQEIGKEYIISPGPGQTIEEMLQEQEKKRRVVGPIITPGDPTDLSDFLGEKLNRALDRALRGEDVSEIIPARTRKPPRKLTVRQIDEIVNMWVDRFNLAPTVNNHDAIWGPGGTLERHMLQLGATADDINAAKTAFFMKTVDKRYPVYTKMLQKEIDEANEAWRFWLRTAGETILMMLPGSQFVSVGSKALGLGSTILSKLAAAGRALGKLFKAIKRLPIGSASSLIPGAIKGAVAIDVAQEVTKKLGGGAPTEVGANKPTLTPTPGAPKATDKTRDITTATDLGDFSGEQLNRALEDENVSDEVKQRIRAELKRRQDKLINDEIYKGFLRDLGMTEEEFKQTYRGVTEDEVLLILKNRGFLELQKRLKNNPTAARAHIERALEIASDFNIDVPGAAQTKEFHKAIAELSLTGLFSPEARQKAMMQAMVDVSGATEPSEMENLRKRLVEMKDEFIKFGDIKGATYITNAIVTLDKKIALAPDLKTMQKIANVLSNEWATMLFVIAAAFSSDPDEAFDSWARAINDFVGLAKGKKDEFINTSKDISKAIDTIQQEQINLNLLNTKNELRLKELQHIAESKNIYGAFTTPGVINASNIDIARKFFTAISGLTTLKDEVMDDFISTIVQLDRLEASRDVWIEKLMGLAERYKDNDTLQNSILQLVQLLQTGALERLMADAALAGAQVLRTATENQNELNLFLQSIFRGDHGQLNDVLKVIKDVTARVNQTKNNGMQ